MKQILEIRNIISITVLKLMHMQNLDLSTIQYIDYPIFLMAYITIYQKENNKDVYFGNFSFHWLEIEQFKKL